MNEALPWPVHGGQGAALRERFGLPADHPLIDFSANLNPLGPPAWVPARLAALVAGLARYPAPDYTRARAAIARREGVGIEQVRLTNGGAEAIFLAAALHAGTRAAIVEPSFAEYARACAAHGLAVSSISLTPPHFRLDPERVAAQLEGCRVLFLCRPHNPTGTLVPREAIERLLTLTEPLGCRVVIDEAFIDFVAANDERLTPLLSRFPHLLLLRSLTKCYTLPGLRLGYLLGEAETVRRVGAHQPPWSVNHLAAELVAPLLDDHDFMTRMHAWLVVEHPRLHGGLVGEGLRVVPSRANFFLVQPAEGAQATPGLFEGLLRHGVLARHTHNFAGLDGGWLRLALRDRADNDRLLAALAEAGGA